MRAFYCSVSVALAASFSGGWWFFAANSGAWAAFTAKYPNAALFAGFLAVAGMMLTFRANILARIKDGFESPQYARTYEAYRETHPKAEYFASIRNLEAALTFTMLLSLVTATAQLSIWFIPHPAASALCIALAGTAFGVLLFLAIQIHFAMRHWVARIEAEKQEALRKDAEDRHVTVITSERTKPAGHA